MVRWITSAILLLALSACEPGGPETGVAGARQVAPVSRDRARALFREHCAICHGVTGNGQGPRRGSLFNKPPDLRQSSWRAGKTPAEIRARIRNGVPGSDMPAWKSLEDDEIAGLAAYVTSLSERGTDTD